MLYQIQDKAGKCVVVVNADSVAELQRKWHDIADCILIRAGYSSQETMDLINGTLTAMQIGK